MDLLLDDDDDREALEFIINGIPRRVYNRSEYFESFDPRTFYMRFRLSKEAVLEFLPQIEENLEYPYDMNNSVSPMNQLLVFLRFCATGNHLSAVADFCGVHTATAGRIVAKVARVVALLYRNHIRFPLTNEEKLQTQTKFYEIARFPKVIGALDCTHIRIQSPGGNDAEVFRNRKHFFSINVQAICNANLEAINLVARWPGSAHDSTIFNGSQIRRDFEGNLHPNLLLIGDSGYMNKSYLITPLRQPVTAAEQLFNESHIRTRNTIERFFGIWKRRFPVLAYGCRLQVDTILSVIVATAVLNNICRRRNEDPPPPENVDFLQAMNENEVPDIEVYNDADNRQGFNVRNEIIAYFQTINGAEM